MRLIALAALLLAGCSATRPDPEPVSAAESLVQTQEDAVGIALRFLAAQPYAAEYEASTAEASEGPAGWTVMIEHVDAEQRRPSYGVISVDKRTGEAAWLPMR